jgi:hypothetical protein
MFQRPFMPEFQVSGVESIGQPSRLFHQGMGYLGPVGQHAADIQIRQTDQEASEKPTSDIGQRQQPDQSAGRFWGFVLPGEAGSEVVLRAAGGARPQRTV